MVVIFDAKYRRRFTPALQQEAVAIEELAKSKKLKVFVWDPKVHSAADIRCNLADGSAGMGDIDKFKVLPICVMTSPLATAF